MDDRTRPSEEKAILQRYDQFRHQVDAFSDMPERVTEPAYIANLNHESHREDRPEATQWLQAFDHRCEQPVGQAVAMALLRRATRSWRLVFAWVKRFNIKHIEVSGRAPQPADALY
ncbi:hypothetical protein [Mesorhizobium kowhaii]|uniref:Uncharacterized protein n=1 Tax=Mesorhizobium kowhaii TaxID=1300272 RepID=A0A2W7CTN2_9HYPH|nr:hypothetical protein [Mesorhizobium kowhaii]PZV37119.1 hypothetical protein B5V02_18075 [Mesorhizobium kowhaii]